jgi:hypothetical protein
MVSNSDFGRLAADRQIISVMSEGSKQGRNFLDSCGPSRNSRPETTVAGEVQKSGEIPQLRRAIQESGSAGVTGVALLSANHYLVCRFSPCSRALKERLQTSITKSCQAAGRLGAPGIFEIQRGFKFHTNGGLFRENDGAPIRGNFINSMMSI